jgi:hypothetical protein
VEDGSEVERDRVVEERLAHEEGEPEHRTPRVALEGHPGDLAERDRLALAHHDLLSRRRWLLPGLRAHLGLDLVDDPLRLLLAAVDEQPARALRHVAAHQQDGEPDHGAGCEGEAPPYVGCEQGGVEQEHRGDRADRGADPVAAVDREIDAPAVAGRDQLVDGGVDRGVLAADAGAGQEAAEEEVPGLRCEGGGHGGEQVEAQRHQEQPLAPVTVGQLTEQQCAEACSGDVDRRGRTDLGRVEIDAAARLREPRRDRAHDRDLEAVEDPDGAEADDDAPVEA